MNRKATIGFLLLFLFHLGIRAWVVGEFQWNRSSYAKEFCVQKDRQINRCKGHCQLQNKLESLGESDPQEKNTKPLSLEEQSEYHLVGFSKPDNFSFSLKLNPNYFYNSHSIQSGFLNGIDRPPQA